MTSCNNSLDDLRKYDFKSHFESDEELAMEKLFRCCPEALLKFASTCCVIFIIIGIPGNLTTIVALARYKKVRNATAIFIINLHISDLIFNSMILPMTAVTFARSRWTFGWTMCRVYPFFKFVLTATSIFTVLAISIIRYVIVCHPLLYPRLYKRRNISIMLVMIWVSAFVLFLAPNFGTWGQYDLDPNGGVCTMVDDKNGRSPKNFFLTCAFLVPYLTITLCYARIWWVVRKTAIQAQNQNPRPSRPKHLPLSNPPSNISDEGTLVNFELSSPGNSTDNEKTPTTTGEEKFFEKYFKAPFRQTIRAVRPTAPTKKDKKLCAMIAAIMISFCVTHIPIMVTRLVYKQYKSEPLANIFSHLLDFLGTCINPIIYVLMSNEYRQAYKGLFQMIMNQFRRHTH